MAAHRITLSRHGRTNQALRPGQLPPVLAPLARQLAEGCRDYPDEYAVTAALESQGLRDVDARERFGYADLFELGALLFPYLPHRPQLAQPPRAVRGWRAAGEFALTLLSGLAYIAPLLGQLVAFGLFGYSLWAWRGFAPPEATQVALATFISLTAMAPLVHILVQRGNYYRYLRDLSTLRLLAARLTRLGLLYCLGLALVLWGIERSTGTDWHLFRGYCLFLALVSLGMGLIEVAGLRWLALLVMGGATALVAYTHEVLGWDIVIGQCAALVVLVVVLFVAAGLRLRPPGGAHSTAPPCGRWLPARVLAAHTWPVASYGVLYYLFLFTDRLVSWTASPLPANTYIQFQPGYEGGVCPALLVLGASIAVLEYPARTCSPRLLAIAARTPPVGPAFTQACLRLYGRYALLLASVSLTSLVMLSVAANAGDAQALGLLRSLGRAQASPAELKLPLLLSAASYSLFAFGLLAAVFLRNFRQGSAVVRALAVAVVVNGVMGALSAHVWGFEAALVGLLTGSLVFAVLTTLSVLRAFRQGPQVIAAALA